MSSQSADVPGSHERVPEVFRSLPNHVNTHLATGYDYPCSPLHYSVEISRCYRTTLPSRVTTLVHHSSGKSILQDHSHHILLLTRALHLIALVDSYSSANHPLVPLQQCYYHSIGAPPLQVDFLAFPHAIALAAIRSKQTSRHSVTTSDLLKVIYSPIRHRSPTNFPAIGFLNRISAIATQSLI